MQDNVKGNRIIAVHLLNDLSGSPYVLRQSLEVLRDAGHVIHLFTATPSGHGFLSNIDGVKQIPIFYRWSTNRWITLLIFLYSQCELFFRILFYLKKDDQVYINSLLPFGAALAARMRRKQVIYHFHEVSIKPILLKKFLISIAGFTASKGIFVSHDLAKRTGLKKPYSIVYNSLPASFIEKAEENFQQHGELPFHVLMICSLKKYKGVDEFLECARRLKSYDFTLQKSSFLFSS